MAFAGLGCGLAMELFEVGGISKAKPFKAARIPRSSRGSAHQSGVIHPVVHELASAFAALLDDGVLFHRAYDEHESICSTGIETAAESKRAHFDIKFDIIGSNSREFRIEHPAVSSDH
jgi:hypothetical protein